MRVLILGGYGFVGAQLMAALSQRGHDVCGAGRDIAFARRRYAFWDWVEIDFADPPGRPRWAEILNGVDAVINCVGVLQDGGRDSTRTAHISGAESVFQACEANGVRRFIQISAVSDGPLSREFLRFSLLWWSGPFFLIADMRERMGIRGRLPAALA